MSTDEYYRRNAAEAQKQADVAKNPGDREGWLRVAQGWLSLIRNRPQTPMERFEEVEVKQGTKQETSNSSH
jgi:hypothetical protein